MNGSPEDARARLTAASLTPMTVTLLISNIGGALFSVALAALLGRGLGADGLGVYAAVSAWIYPLTLLADFGVSSLLTRELAADVHAADRYLRGAALARLIIGGGVAAALIALAPLLSSDARMVFGLQVSAPLVIILPFYSAFTAVLRAHGDVRAIPFLNVGMIAAQAGLTALALEAGFGLRAALILNVITSAGQLVVVWIWYRWRFFQPTPDRIPALPGLLRAAWHFALAGVFAAVQGRASLILLEVLADAAQVGYFSAATRFIDAARLLPNAFFGALFPTLSALVAQSALFRRTFRRAGRWLAIYGIASVTAAALIGGPAIDWVFGSAFAAAYPALILAAGAFAFSLLRGLATLAWYAHRGESRVNGVNAGALLVLIGLSAVLIPAGGATGAALALLLSEAAGYVWLRHQMPVHSGTMTEPAART